MNFSDNIQCMAISTHVIQATIGAIVGFLLLAAIGNLPPILIAEALHESQLYLEEAKPLPTLEGARIASVSIIQAHDGYGIDIPEGGDSITYMVVVEFTGSSPSGNTGFTCQLDNLTPGPCADDSSVTYKNLSFVCGSPTAHTVTVTAYDKSDLRVLSASDSFSWTITPIC